MNLQQIKHVLYSVLAFLMLGFGISLQIKAGIGLSMFNAFSLLLADLCTAEVGTLVNVLNLLFLAAYLIMKHSPISRHDIILITATIMNGYVINFFTYALLGSFVINAYPLRLLVFFIGLLLASLSLGIILAMGIIQFPLEGLCIQIGQRLGYSLATVRMGFDVFFLLGTLSLTLLSSHTLYIREGTVISFLLFSRLLGLSYTYCQKHRQKT